MYNFDPSSKQNFHTGLQLWWDEVHIIRFLVMAYSGWILILFTLQNLKKNLYTEDGSCSFTKKNFIK